MSEVDPYLRLPWTVRVENRADDGGYIALFVVELEGFVVTGATPKEANANYWDALELFLQSFLDDGDEIPVPEGCGPEPEIEGGFIWAPSVSKRTTASAGSCPQTPKRTPRRSETVPAREEEFAYG